MRRLRVIKAFKSTLEDLEERRSIHSLHSLHSLRSSRSHIGLRPLSDFAYIDEDPSSAAQNATNKSSVKCANQSQDDANFKGSRMQSLNSPASPLLLSVPGTTGPAATYNHHFTTINTTNNNQSPSSNALDQAATLSPATTQTSSTKDTGNSLLANPSNLVLPQLTKLVHETSI